MKTGLLSSLLIAIAPALPAPRSDVATPRCGSSSATARSSILVRSICCRRHEVEYEALDKARAASQVFVFEAPLDEGGGAMMRFVEKAGRLPFGRTLADILPAKVHADLEEAAWRVQYPPKMLEPLRPWLAGVYLELYSYIKVGFSSFYGVDHVIEQEAKDRGAERAYLETVEEQLSNFSALSRHGEIAYLTATVRGVLAEPDMPLALARAWATADTDGLAKTIDEGFAEVPQLRAQLLVGRNRKWIPKLRAMLASDKTHFVTVGVGHLVGRDSVVAMLRARGYKVTGP
jgi:uncharacterized protein YbaP (TraB family)